MIREIKDMNTWNSYETKIEQNEKPVGKWRADLNVEIAV